MPFGLSDMQARCSWPLVKRTAAGSARKYRLGTVEFVTVDTPEGQASYRIVELAQAAFKA